MCNQAEVHITFSFDPSFTDFNSGDDGSAVERLRCRPPGESCTDILLVNRVVGTVPLSDRICSSFLIPTAERMLATTTEELLDTLTWKP